MMESKKKAFSLYDIVMIGLMAAVVFVVTMFLSIRIPTPTFLRFFLMAWLCGVIAYAGAAAAKKFARNLVACLAGAVFSSLLYMLKGIIELMIGGSALVPAFVANIPKLMTSPPNIVIAVVVAMALLPALQKAMHSTSFGRHMAEK